MKNCQNNPASISCGYHQRNFRRIPCRFFAEGAEVICSGNPSVIPAGTSGKIRFRTLGEIPKGLPGRSSVRTQVEIGDETLGETTGRIAE